MEMYSIKGPISLFVHHIVRMYIHAAVLHWESGDWPRFDETKSDRWAVSKSRPCRAPFSRYWPNWSRVSWWRQYVMKIGLHTQYVCISVDSSCLPQTYIRLHVFANISNEYVPKNYKQPMFYIWSMVVFFHSLKARLVCQMCNCCQAKDLNVCQ